MNIWVLAAATGFMSTPATAQSLCQSFVGQKVDAKDIDAIMQPFGKIGPRDEFESMRQYEARKSVAVSTLPEMLIVKKEPEHRKHLVYDPDHQILNIASYAFRNLGFNSDALFGSGAPYRGVVEAGMYNKEVVIQEDEKVTSTYSASNAYGANVQVSKIFRRTRGVFEGKAQFSQTSLFPAADRKPHIAGSIAMTPDVARKLKPGLQLAFVVYPKSPYFLRAIYEFPSRPTITNPREVTNEVSALIGDIKCGLVLDADDYVLGGFETH